MIPLTRREADIFACLVDTVCAGPAAPSALGAFEHTLSRAPRVNRVGLRALLYAAELAPRLMGRGARLRRLAPADRRAALTALTHGRVGGPFEGLAALAKLSHYSDDAIMRSLGYDADAVVARGRELRRTEARW